MAWFGDYFGLDTYDTLSEVMINQRHEDKCYKQFIITKNQVFVVWQMVHRDIIYKAIEFYQKATFHAFCGCTQVFAFRVFFCCLFLFFRMCSSKSRFGHHLRL